MSFETTAEISIAVADSELRSAREQVEDALGDISVGVDVGAGDDPPGVTDGGLAPPQRQRRRRRRLFQFARQRTDDVETIAEEIADAEFSGGAAGGGGGGGGLLPVNELLTGTLIGRLLGGKKGGGGGILKRLKKLAPGLAGATGGLAGVLGAGGVAGLLLQNAFEKASFDESQLETGAEDFDFNIASVLGESIQGIDLGGVSEALRTEGITLEGPEDLTPQVAEILAEQIPSLDAQQVLDIFASKFDIDIPDSALGSRFEDQNMIGNLGQQLSKEVADALPGAQMIDIAKAVRGNVDFEVTSPEDINREVVNELNEEIPTLDFGQIVNRIIAQFQLPTEIGRERTQKLNKQDGVLQTEIDRQRRQRFQKLNKQDGVLQTETPQSRQRTQDLNKQDGLLQNARSSSADQVPAELNNQQQITVNVEAQLDKLTSQTVDAVEQEVDSVRDEIGQELEQLRSDIRQIRQTSTRRGL